METSYAATRNVIVPSSVIGDERLYRLSLPVYTWRHLGTHLCHVTKHARLLGNETFYRKSCANLALPSNRACLVT